MSDKVQACEQKFEQTAGGYRLTIECTGATPQEELAQQRALDVLKTDNPIFQNAGDKQVLVNETRKAVMDSLAGKLEGPLRLLQSREENSLNIKSAAYAQAMKAAGIDLTIKRSASGSVEALQFSITNPPGVRNVMHPGYIGIQKDGQHYHQSAQSDSQRRSYTADETQAAFSRSVRNSILRLK